MTPKFTTPCYVRVEDKDKRKEVCEQLKKIGYDGDYLLRSHYVITGLSVFINTETNNSECWIFDNRKDCGTNAELFLALAGMRSDTDEGQWFVSHGFKLFDKLKGTVETSTGRKSIMAGEWFKPLIKNIKFKWLGNHEFHQATAQEIIEHFSQPTE